MKYLLFDFSNLAHRTFHIVNEPDYETRKKYIMGGILHALYDIYTRFEPDKCVYVFDTNSWRKKIYEPYKANRQEQFKDDKEGKELIFLIISTFYEFIKNKTTAYALRYPDAECDDLISVFVKNHPNDEIVIASTDTDFYQLVSPNVSLFSPITKNLVMNNKVVDYMGQEVPFSLDSNGKLKIGKLEGVLLEDISDYGTWQEWCLFCKTIRGDASDNVFSAYPGVRVKGTKKSVGIMDAFKGRKSKDFNYVNFVNQTWTDHEGQEKLVESQLNLNNRLINLSCIDQEYYEKFDAYIKEYEQTKVEVPRVGMNVGQFINQYDLSVTTNEIYAFTRMFK